MLRQEIFSCFWLVSLEPMRSTSNPSICNIAVNIFDSKKSRYMLSSRPCCYEEHTSFDSSLHRLTRLHKGTSKNEDFFESLTENVSVCTRLMGFGDRNQIVDNSDSKPANFDRRFWSDSKSNNESESTIAILIEN